MTNTDRCCISYWLPILQAAGLPTPKTEILRTDVELIYLLDGKTPSGFDAFIDRLGAACDRMGYPAFLRAGDTSAKHRWKNTCYLSSRDELQRHVTELVEFGECSSLSGLFYNVWAVREFIPMHSTFTAFGGDLPINRERRYFVGDGKIICHHPYWPASAIYLHSKDEDWILKLELLNEESPSEIETLSAMALKAASAFDGKWSLDFSQATDGKWWAIDMAPMERSYHWEGCANAGEEKA